MKSEQKLGVVMNALREVAIHELVKKIETMQYPKTHTVKKDKVFKSNFVNT